MKKLRQLTGSRPAIAVTAIIVTAVVVAGGLAGALPGRRTVATNDLRTGAVNSRVIENSSVRSRDIANETILSRDIRNGTITADDLAPGTTGPAVLFAKVDAGVSGTTILSSEGVIGSGRFSEGVYWVAFDRDITNCAWVGNIIDLEPDGVIGVNLEYLERSPFAENPETLIFRSFDEAGAVAEMGDDDGFSVIVTC